MQQISKQPAFELDQIVATPGALAALKKAGQQPGEFLTRRVHGEGRKAGELTRRNGRTIGQTLSRTPFLKIERRSDSTLS